MENTTEEEYREEVKKHMECQSLYKEVMPKKCLIRIYDIYERDSIERFGDDLTEEILYYLSLKDKVKFEYVCKQWQRLVFNKQRKISLECRGGKDTLSVFNFDYPHKVCFDSDIRISESVLKKCPNISEAHLSKDDYGFGLDLITKYCRRITTLSACLSSSEASLMSCATKHGIWLKNLSMPDHDYSPYIPNYVKNFIQMCPNVETIMITLGEDFSTVIDMSDSLKKLKVIKWVRISNGELNRLELLVNKYGTNLEAIQIRFSNISSDELKTCFAHISRFESLESLKLHIDCSPEEPIDECLKLLANKYTKLIEFPFKTLFCKI